MGFEVDFLAVGDKKSGDAIALRYGDLAGPRSAQRIVVIDGGFVDDGARVVAHIQTYYHTDEVDLVVSTHPDQDHIGGPVTVVETLNVRELWMHLPSTHSVDLAEGRSQGYASKGFAEPLQKSLEGADVLVTDAKMLLFTADAGIDALSRVADDLEARRIAAGSLSFVQIHITAAGETSDQQCWIGSWVQRVNRRLIQQPLSRPPRTARPSIPPRRSRMRSGGEATTSLERWVQTSFIISTDPRRQFGRAVRSRRRLAN
jgi:hypothetical protein